MMLTNYILVFFSLNNIKFNKNIVLYRRFMGLFQSVSDKVSIIAVSFDAVVTNTDKGFLSRLIDDSISPKTTF